MTAAAAAHLTIHRDTSVKAHRYIGIELTGGKPGEMRVTTRKLDTTPDVKTLPQAMDAYCAEWGLTIVGEPVKIGCSLQADVR